MDIEELKSREERDLVQKITKSESSGGVVSTILKTDEKVIARVTDGIYRQPGSAIRELISNAYDADASRVVIKTDAPRFEKKQYPLRKWWAFTRSYVTYAVAYWR